MKEISKNFLKTLKKVLTNENECDIIIHALLRRFGKNRQKTFQKVRRTLKIKQRER